jgi:hypothetical protein
MCGASNKHRLLQIPTGELAAVQGTPFDFSRSQHSLLGPAITAIDGGGKPGLGEYVRQLASHDSYYLPVIIVCAFAMIIT